MLLNKNTDSEDECLGLARRPAASFNNAVPDRTACMTSNVRKESVTLLQDAFRLEILNKTENSSDLYLTTLTTEKHPCPAVGFEP